MDELAKWVGKAYWIDEMVVWKSATDIGFANLPRFQAIHRDAGYAGIANRTKLAHLWRDCLRGLSRVKLENNEGKPRPRKPFQAPTC